GENIYDKPTIGSSRGMFDYNFPLLTKEDLEKRYKKDTAVEIEVAPKTSFFKVYTPLNILREIKGRLK
ncbi:MAG: hypothetical protein RL108_405, partial [Bacteroidota bacterium]